MIDTLALAACRSCARRQFIYAVVLCRGKNRAKAGLRQIIDFRAAETRKASGLNADRYQYLNIVILNTTDTDVPGADLPALLLLPRDMPTIRGTLERGRDAGLEGILLTQAAALT